MSVLVTGCKSFKYFGTTFAKRKRQTQENTTRENRRDSKNQRENNVAQVRKN